MLKKDALLKFKNPLFWGQLFISISLMCLAYFNLEPSDIITFPILWDTIKKIFSNPYMIGQIIWFVWLNIYNPIHSETDNQIITARKGQNDKIKR